ncbi:MAG: DEAD/DEAH box helicase [Rhodothermales bacterium]
MISDVKGLRKEQQVAVEKAVQFFNEGKKSITLILCPGYGKTLASQLICNELARLGHIDGAVSYVPRLTLSRQYELDWRRDKEEFRSGLFHINFPWVHGAFADLLVGDFLEVDNEFPLISPRIRSQFGAVTTYSSLCKNPPIHFEQFKQGRYVLILDEAHQLGQETEGGQGTQSAKLIEQLAEYAAFTIIMTGTEVRTDGKKILPKYINYEERTGDNGEKKLYLLPDVLARYTDGVRDGYLRKFWYNLIDVNYQKVYANRTEAVNIAYEDGSIKEAVKHPHVWQSLVDNGVERLLKGKQNIDQRLCELITAVDQAHARKIHKYIQEKYPRLKSLIAVSDDGSKAKNNLEDFKQGGYDILVTVKMAYIGYSYKWLMYWVCASHYRAFLDLEQTAGRIIRTLPISTIPLKKQLAEVIAPGDVRMRNFLVYMKECSERGIAERNEEEEKEPRKESTYAPELYKIDNVSTKPGETMSLFPEVEQPVLPKKPAFNFHNTLPVNVGPRPKTHRDTLEELRAKLQRAMSQTNTLFAKKYNRPIDHTLTANACAKHFGEVINDNTIRTPGDVVKRMKWLQHFRRARQLPVPNFKLDEIEVY